MTWCWQKLFFFNPRGQRLCGLLHAPQEGPRGEPVVITCHGFTGTKEGGGLALAMAEALAEKVGVACFLFDFAGSGESEGAFADLTLSGQIADLTAAVDYAEALGFGPVVTLGRSFGGTTVLCQAAEDRRVLAACTWSAVAFPRRTFPREHARPAAGGLLAWDSLLGVRVYLREGFFADLERHDVAACAGLLSPRPVLFCHGEADEIVPASDARALWEAARPPKELFVVPGADHSYRRHYRLVWEAFFRWLKETALAPYLSRG